MKDKWKIKGCRIVQVDEDEYGIIRLHLDTGDIVWTNYRMHLLKLKTVEPHSRSRHKKPCCNG